MMTIFCQIFCEIPVLRRSMASTASSATGSSYRCAYSAAGARNELIDLEDLTDEELDEIAAEFHKLRDRLVAKRSK